MDKIKTDVGLVQDVRGLDQLRKLSAQDAKSQKKALETAAQQFESIFNQMWVSGMRKSNEALNPDSPLNSRYSQFYQGMLDDQMTSSLASKGPNSLAKMIVKQLSPQQSAVAQHTQSTVAPRTLKMPTDRLPVMRRIGNTDHHNTGMTNASNTDVIGLAAKNSQTTVSAGVAAAERFAAKLAQQGQSSRIRSGSGQRSGAFSSPEDFVRQLLPVAQQVGKQMGISPVALLAQAALETGWGRHVVGKSSSNLFGIKAGSRWQGAETKAASLEYENGHPVMRTSAFRSYGSYAQSMQDYANLIGQNDRYSKALAVAHDPEAYFDALQKAGYATDPHYARKLKQVLRSDVFNGLRAVKAT